MDWADELAASVDGPQVVNDSKTPSGTVHVGSLRGPVILDVITRALRARGLETTLLYGVDDLDPMDAQALLSPDAIEREMGRPLAHVADPAGDCHPSYARHFAGIFIDTFAGLGIVPDRYYWMSDIYPTGQMDPFIRTALERAGTVREVYRRVANVQHPDHWLPLGVICPNCGKVGTTIASDWDGETVSIACRPDLVQWATGCGWTGRVSPFGGNAKLPWNLEWAAQWSLFGVTIEPNGKDLATAGGSRDRSNAIAREVFEREPPRNVPYEFLNIGGRKMSTSKGRGRGGPHDRQRCSRPSSCGSCSSASARRSSLEFDPEGTRRDPAPVRRVRPARRRDRRAARSRASCRRATSRSSATRSSIPAADVAAVGGALPARVRPPRPARPDPGHRRPGAGRDGEGQPADRGRVGRARGAPRRGPTVARGLRPGARADRDQARRAAARGGAAPPRAAAGSCARSPTVAHGEAVSQPASSGRPRSSRSRRSTASTRRRPSTRCTSRSSAGPTARAPAGCSPASSATSSSAASTEAGAAGEGSA